MRKCLLATVVCFFCYTTVLAEDWPQWRGPSFNGSTTDTNLPSHWSTTENVAWKASLPGPSASTPVVMGDHVFISGTDTAREKLVAMCFDRRNGELRWSHDVADRIRKDSRSNFASSSPATDGKLVVFFYGSGHLVAFDLEGSQLWAKDIQDEFGEFAFLWTFSTSPLLYDGRLYIQVLQRDVAVDGRGLTDRGNESYLLALDPQSGNVLWRHVRPSDARQESLEAFTTPIPFQHDGRSEILVAGGDDLSGHDPTTGRELWRWGTWNPTRIGHWRLVPSPVASDDVILACAPKRSPIYAVKAGGEGNLEDDALAWVSDDNPEISSDVPTPAFCTGDFFILSDVRYRLSRVEPNTGTVKWSVGIPRGHKFEASPLVADGKVYIINFAGTVVVFDAETGEQISQISMDEPSEDPVRSSIIAAHGQLFVKTTDALYCIGQG
jgi:outer membrane protein assembly factor BamB